MADFFKITAREAGLASGLSKAADLDVGVLVYGSISAGAMVLEQLFRPDPIDAMTRLAITMATERMPPLIGTPIAYALDIGQDYLKPSVFSGLPIGGVCPIR